MTTLEFSLEFEALYNNIMSNQAPGLNAYEKSIFLTQAQEEFINAMYEGSLTGFTGFEKTERATQYLGNLVKTVVLPVVENTVKLPEDLMYIVLEEAISKGANRVKVTTHDEFHSLKNNPFYSNYVLRLLQGNTIKLSFNKELKEYYISYIKRPNPIILEDIPKQLIETLGGMEEVQPTIEGKFTKTECELPVSTHRQILTIAVNLAKAAWRN